MDTMTPEGIEQLKRHEGKRLKAYRCPANVLTIGYGHTGNVKEGQSITNETAEHLLVSDIGIAEETARRLIPNYNLLSLRRQDAVVNLAFNLGYFKMSKFYNTLNYIRTERFDLAANSLEHSAWYSQVGDRAKEIVQMIREG